LINFELINCDFELCILNFKLNIMSFNVKIITPDATIFSGPADAVYAPAENGDIGILEDHAPYACALKDGMIEIIHSGKKKEIPIADGVLEVKEDGEVVVLI